MCITYHFCPRKQQETKTILWDKSVRSLGWSCENKKEEGSSFFYAKSGLILYTYFSGILGSFNDFNFQ